MSVNSHSMKFQNHGYFDKKRQKIKKKLRKAVFKRKFSNIYSLLPGKPISFHKLIIEYLADLLYN